MISHDAKQSKQAAKKHTEMYRNFTRTNMARVYPTKWAVKSGNFCPLAHWAVGAQMVALNYQTTATIPMRLNYAHFQLNGNCGYVLKPAYLTSEQPQAPTKHKIALTLPEFNVNSALKQKYDNSTGELWFTVQMHSPGNPGKKKHYFNETSRIVLETNNKELTFVEFKVKLRERSSCAWIGKFKRARLPIGQYVVAMSALEDGKSLGCPPRIHRNLRLFSE